MSCQALKQFKLLEQSLNNIGFIYSRQSLLFATGVLHKARRQLGRQSHPAAEGSWNVTWYKGPFFTWGCYGAMHFRLLSTTEWSHECISVLRKAHGYPQKYANKNLFRLPHRKCSPHSTSSQGYPDQNHLTHNGDRVCLWPLFRGQMMKRTMSFLLYIC